MIKFSKNCVFYRELNWENQLILRKLIIKKVIPYRILNRRTQIMGPLIVVEQKKIINKILLNKVIIIKIMYLYS